jgi:hypothetical protein
VPYEALHPAEAEKQKAKADAEAKAREAEAAKAQARQQKEQEEAAKKAEAERVKAEQTAKKAEEQRLAEEARKAKEVAKPAPKPKPEPAPKPDPPAPVAKADPPKPKPAPAPKPQAPKPPPPPPPVQRNALSAKAHAGDDGRRALAPRTSEEASPVRKAAPVSQQEERPEVKAVVADVVRKEELIVEPNQVVTVVLLETDAQKAEYRKVVRKYGTIHYFKNGQPCSQLVYESEAMAEVR